MEPNRIGPFQILSLIGTGGMSRVYRARKQGEKRYCALKVLSHERAKMSPSLLSRFRRECQMLIQLEHPHIVRVREAGEAGGQYYLVMELLPGESLKACLKRGPLPLEDLLRLMRETAAAMIYCHERGIYHRDLKPSNVFRVFDGSSKVLDFGLAKGQADQRLTNAGRRIGTPRYMAPEVIRGASADDRSEIYQLGLIYYEAATARPAYPEKDVATVLENVLSGRYISLKQATPELAMPLRAIIHRCMARDPAKRFATVRDLAHALEGVKSGGSGS